MDPCVFCQIASGTSPSHRGWEDEDHVAFLSIFPNTEGVTVVIPRQHYASYAFDLPDEALVRLVLAAKQVARLIDRNLGDVGRTALVFEGFGVDHVHAKLFPMHGTAHMREWQPLAVQRPEYFHAYEGFIATYDGERADEAQLARIAAQIRGEALAQS
jgi:histidine triad (HIT) family protein